MNGACLEWSSGREQSGRWRSGHTDPGNLMVDTWKLATDVTKEPKSRLAVRGDQEEKSLLLEEFSPTVSKAAYFLFYA